LGDNSSGNGEKKGNYEYVHYMHKCRLDNDDSQPRPSKTPREGKK